MHDQGLGQQADHEPAGLEQALVAGGARIEHVPHQREAGQVEDRADRPEEHHEAADVRRVPLQWPAYQLLVHVVERNGDLRDVVQQVLHQQLQRQHRQERQEGGGHQHREHIAEVGTGGHADVLQHVVERAPAPDDTFLQHHQVLFQQDDVSRLLGDVHCTVHTYADIGRTQCRGIVDAVTEEADHLALGAQLAYQPFLAQRRQPGEHAVVVQCP